MKTYDQGGITVNKINDMCFCNLNITFDNTIEPWGGTWYLGNIADPEFRAPYEKHFPCVGINQEAGISYALRISVAASGNVTIINDTKDAYALYLAVHEQRHEKGKHQAGRHHHNRI